MYTLEFDPHTKKQLKKLRKNKKQYLRLWEILEGLKEDPYAPTQVWKVTVPGLSGVFQATN